MAKIYLFEIQEDERSLLTELLRGHELVMQEEMLTTENAPHDAEIISVFVGSKVNATVLEKMPGLRAIATRSTGFDHVDLSYTEAHGIAVLNVPSYGEHTVAEFAFGLLLNLTRKIIDAVKQTRENVCIAPEFVRGMDLSGRTIGVMGAGRIGRKMITMAKGFGMHVIAYDAYQDQAAAEQLGFTYVRKEELFRDAEVISLHMSATPENHHILNREAFAAMRPGVIIINTARGELIDTHALIEALQGGKVGAAGLDVVEGEELLNKKCNINIFNAENSDTLIRESAELSMLKSMPNVLLTPHIAYDTREALDRISATTSENILKFISGNPVHVVVKGKKPNGSLILVRHTESEWNAQCIWTGSRNVCLTEKGFEDARLLGRAIEEIHIDHAYSSAQVRTLETLSSMLGTMRQPTVPITRDAALNERDYGDYTGKNKQEMKELFGDQFDKIRRGWDVPIPNGETLKMVYERVVPYYQKEIMPRILRGENVLIVSHGNALRALMKYIESLSDEDIEKHEVAFGGAVVYTIDDNGHSIAKELRDTPSLTYDHV